MTDQAAVENEDFWNAVSEDEEQNTDQAASSESESEDVKPDEGEPSKESTPSPTLKVVKDGKRWKFKGEPANFSKVKQAAAKLLNEKRMDSKSIKKHADRLIAALTGRGVSAEEAQQTWKALYDETVKNEQIAKKGKDTKEAKKKFASFKQHLGTEEKSPCNLNSPSVFGSKALERQSSKRKAEEEEEEEEKPQVEEKRAPNGAEVTRSLCFPRASKISKRLVLLSLSKASPRHRLSLSSLSRFRESMAALPLNFFMLRTVLVLMASK